MALFLLHGVSTWRRFARRGIKSSMASQPFLPVLAHLSEQKSLTDTVGNQGCGKVEGPPKSVLLYRTDYLCTSRGAASRLRKTVRSSLLRRAQEERRRSWNIEDVSTLSKHGYIFQQPASLVQSTWIGVYGFYNG